MILTPSTGIVRRYRQHAHKGFYIYRVDRWLSSNSVFIFTSQSLHVLHIRSLLNKSTYMFILINFGTFLYILYTQNTHQNDDYRLRTCRLEYLYLQKAYINVTLSTSVRVFVFLIFVTAV